MQLPFTGERYVPEVRGQIYYEHVHRYALAFEMARDLDVLDIASGEGYGAAYLAIVARSVVGVDIDAESVRHAAARYTAMNLSFRTGSCTRIPLPSESIDLVVSFETIEHIEEHEQFMRELVRVLRPHGRLLISSPNKLVYSDKAQYRNPYHARELYFDEFRDLLQNWFPFCRVYGQRIIATSAIHPLRGVARDARCIGPSPHADERGLPTLPAPVYFVALCSRSQAAHDGAPEPLDSVFVDPRDDLLQDIVHPEPMLARANAANDDVDSIASADATPPAAVALPATVQLDAARADAAQPEALQPDAVQPHAVQPAVKADAVRSDAVQPGDAVDRDAQLAALEAELAAREAELADLRAAFAAERQRAAASDAGRLEAEAARDAHARRADEAEHEASRLRAGLEQLERERAEEVAALRAAVDAAQQRLAAAAADVARLERSTAAVEGRARTAADQCRALERRIDELQSAFSEAAARGDETQAELARARGELAHTRAQLDGIMRSTSWRMTRPLRQALQPFRRGT
jgi:SAM-dependent methyltransferase